MSAEVLFYAAAAGALGGALSSVVGTWVRMCATRMGEKR